MGMPGTRLCWQQAHWHGPAVIAHSTPCDTLQGCQAFFPPGLFDNGRAGRGQLAAGWEMLGGKFALMADMLAELRRTSTDRVVIVSNYTQTLDLFGQLCRQCNVSWFARSLSLCEVPDSAVCAACIVSGACIVFETLSMDRCCWQLGNAWSLCWTLQCLLHRFCL